MKHSCVLRRRMRFGDELYLRGTNERVVLLGVVDSDEGLLRVGSPSRGSFDVRDDEVAPVRPRHDGCGCQ